jgi:protocatechuate 4,5-dioxygenase alpha chain
VFAAANAAVPADAAASYDAVVREYDDIPGTFVFDGRRSREGYWLNMFCMSLRDEANREAFRADEKGYLDRFALTPEQREAVLTRDWLRMLELGGNIYYTFKLAACDGMTFQQLAAKQTGVSEEEYVEMMLAGGRGIEGNRSNATATASNREGGTGRG